MAFGPWSAPEGTPKKSAAHVSFETPCNLFPVREGTL